MATYFFYRYQITPNKSRFHPELDFDGSAVNTIEELDRKKRIYFTKALDQYLDYRTDAILSQGIARGDIYEMQFARRKVVEIEKDFQKKKILTEPSLQVVICTNPEIQMIAMKWGTKAFQTKEAAIRWIDRRISRFLYPVALDLSISPVYKSEDFWHYALQNTDNISGIQFTITYPNLPSARKEIWESLKTLTKDTNSGKTTLQLSSAGKGSLEINKDNEYLKNLVDYSAEGGSKIKIREEGSRRFINLKTKPITRDFKDKTPLSINIETFKDVLKESTMRSGDGNE